MIVKATEQHKGPKMYSSNLDIDSEQMCPTCFRFKLSTDMNSVFRTFLGVAWGDPIGPTKLLCTRVLLQNAMLMTKVIRETRRPALEGSKQSWLLQGGFQESPSTRCQSHVESHCVVERNCMDSLNLGEIRLLD